MSEEADRIIAKALDTIPKICLLGAGTNCPYEEPTREMCRKCKYAKDGKPPAYSTCDPDALEGIKALQARKIIDVECRFHEDGDYTVSIGRGFHASGVISEETRDSLAAAFADAMVEVYTKWPDRIKKLRGRDYTLVEVPQGETAYRLRPEIEKLLGESK